MFEYKRKRKKIWFSLSLIALAMRVPHCVEEAKSAFSPSQSGNDDVDNNNNGNVS